ncbi:hypothetical protein GCM10009557_01030 [Virgisporangium ochraceum]|uniref:Uncharacterized protein n=1 Tax=Virgisporangium ochraceum TaxID=65505 RepID=A0A8J4A6B1_9ACTN|nr:hypothetical protein [Virgisporangium ochraceum]GIJ74135.1 hypothetical protein Voc01_090520 [Virgisporangium ochraceum]
MTAVPLTLTRRPRTTGRAVAARTPAPTTLVLVSDVEAAASANLGRCNDDNPYR